jgi:hypothetical protein
VRVAPAAETLRQITRRRAYSEFPDHRIDEQTIAPIAVATDRPRAAGKQILDPGELVANSDSIRPPFRFDVGHHSEMKRAT